jgi:hypothetical protein
MLLAGSGENVSQSLKSSWRVNLPGGIVRRVDNDQPRIFVNRCLDGSQVKVKVFSIELDTHRHTAAIQDHALIEEPGRAVKYHFISIIQNGVKDNIQSSRRSIGHENILWLEWAIQQALQRFGYGINRLGFVEFVGVPILVLWSDGFFQGLHKARQRHFMWVTKREVAGIRAGISYPLAVLEKELIDSKHGVESTVDSGWDLFR